MTVSFEDRLREQLHATSPYRQSAPVGLDPLQVIAAGRRVQRRRRWATALVTVVAVGAIAGGSVVVTSTRRSAQPQPAGPTPAATVTPGMVELRAPGNASPDAIVHVVLAPTAPGKVTATFTQVPTDASGAPATGGWFASAPLMTPTTVSVDGAHPRIAASGAPGSTFVVGLVPSTTAKSVDVRFDVDTQGYSQALEPVPGTSYSAFVLRLWKPLPSSYAITSMSWFRSDGAPVDSRGRVGTVVPFEGGTLYLNADDTELGRTPTDGGTYSTAFGTRSGIPQMALQGKPGSADENVLHITALLPSAASRGVATTSDGKAHPFVTTPVDARYSAFLISDDVGTGTSPHIVKVVWTSDAEPGTAHTVTSP